MDNLLPVGSPSSVAHAEVLPSLLRPELVQRHLERVLLSSEMRRSKMLCQFLRFTVEEVLRGHGTELKEYAIAVGVFRRAREFDPGSDPIVRVQARRLRSKLEQYYQTEGVDEPIRIHYRVGGYSPIFVRRANSLEARPAVIAERASARLIGVLPFVNVGPEACELFSDGLTDELIHALSSSPGVQVVARGSCFQFKGRSEDVRAVGERLGVCALVAGTVRIEGTQVRVLAQLIDTATGVNRWSSAYDREMLGVLATQLEISLEIAGVVGFQLANLPSGASSSRAV